MSDDGGFSVTVPRSGIVSRKIGKDITVALNLKDFACTVEKTKRSDARLYVNKFKEADEAKFKVSKSKLNKNLVARVIRHGSSHFQETLYIATPNHLYTLTFSASTGKDVDLRRSVASVSIDGQFISGDSQSDETDSTEKQSLDEINSSVEIGEALKMPDSPNSAVTFGKISRDALPFEAGYSRHLFIVRKPKPSYTDAARKNGVQGTITASVEFKADGTIGAILVDPDLDMGLARNVGEVAKKIKFVPAQIDGKAVTVTRRISYGFAIY